MKKWLIIAIVLLAVLVLAAIAYPFLQGMFSVLRASDFEWHGFTFPLYFDMEDAAWETYDLIGISTTVFIDQDGGVVGTWFGSMTEDELRELLAAFGGMEHEQ